MLRHLTAAILAGGLGTRLRPVIGERPKVLAPVHGRPFLTYLLDQLAEACIEEVVLLTGYQAERVYQSVGDRYLDLRLIHRPERRPLGTAGSVREALPSLNSPVVLVMNGDSYCDVDVGAFWDFHRSQAADLSLVITSVSDTARYGRVETAANGRVLRFDEKDAAAGPGWINVGIYLLKRALIEEIPRGRPLSLERDFLPAWLGERRVCAFPCAGPFLDIGTPQSYAAAESFFASTVRQSSGLAPARAT
jgi:NDP-sugar pyrophosphorylase family protein